MLVYPFRYGVIPETVYRCCTPDGFVNSVYQASLDAICINSTEGVD